MLQSFTGKRVRAIRTSAAENNYYHVRGSPRLPHQANIVLQKPFSPAKPPEKGYGFVAVPAGVVNGHQYIVRYYRVECCECALDIFTWLTMMLMLIVSV